MCFQYDSETGVFTHLFGPRRGRVAGSKDGTKRVMLAVEGKSYYAHRVAWLYVHGIWPEGQIDHIDGNGLNNRISNLRDVTSAVNLQNRHFPTSRNKVGVLGVTKVPSTGKFAAHIQTDRKSKHIGTFDTVEGAYAAYVQAKRKDHPGNTL